MTSSNLFVDIHIVQDVPPANLNRDASGSPKSARYGGVDRLRVSSQAWKRATRLDFSREIKSESLGIRTRRVHETFRHALTRIGMAEGQASAATAALLSQINIKPGKKEDESAYLFFFSRHQLELMATQVANLQEFWDKPSDLVKRINLPELLGQAHSLDVALFGRMVADLPRINVEAAAQVSHAIATHSSPNQFDYFTAVDDAQEGAEPGAGMIGTVEFNSATLYRYATICVPELISNMDDKAAALTGLGQFIRSFTTSMPTGKQNTFAAHTRPGFIHVVLRSDQPVNYVSAFERPVGAGHEGYFASSVEALCKFIANERTRWGDLPSAQFACYHTEAGADPDVVGPSLPFPTMVKDIVEAASQELADV